MADSKRAYVFPGQGAQAVGMGRDLAEHHPAAARVFEEADSALGISLSTLCFEGPEEALKDTANAQPAIVAASIAAYEAFRAAGGPQADMMAGHSLGEYSALIAAGAMTFPTGIRLVRRRGELMAEAGKQRGGTMAAILGLENDALHRLCKDDSGTVVIANLNSPGQAVISGEADAVERVGAAAKDAGAKRVIPLAVSGAFHSPLVQPASDAMAHELNDAPLDAPPVPVYANVTARPVGDAYALKDLLTQQIVSQVRWEETVRNMIADGARTFVELGPGKVLSNLIRRIDASVMVHNVEDSASLEKTLSALNA
ncbi:MAG: ACP S-malonyltransferase [Armatimonadetes bacterium]|nr:ACP S-malonyltransferase [Armatimonadota bacterium]